ncbi:sortase domain-bontaining protein [Streptomyces sp. NPDC018031]|uniref:class E sortase n=1 Tax=Streptomyces sp. NPDC018031 TaxID=3365033 RepID=UPI0037B8DF6D
MSAPLAALIAVIGSITLVLAGCVDDDPASDTPSPTPHQTSPPTPDKTKPTPPGTNPSTPEETKPAPRDTAPRTDPAALTIPAIGVRELRVVPYEGTTDDWPGTRIQNRGVAASPYGDRGGVGPGETGNYLVTAHRLSAGGPLRDLPALGKGDKVHVTSGGTIYEYEITETRETSFRSQSSLAAQRAAVPGSPGERPVAPMITISTCATPEDNADGNFWRDDKGNPEHRIDKVGVLTSERDAPTP